ncbi:MAG: ComF family protein [Acidimicrobiales bacterium]
MWCVAAHSGRVRHAIAGLKYRGEHRRADLLGAMVAAYLLAHAPWFEDIELIVPMADDHTTAILSAVAPHVAGLWPIQVPPRWPVLVKRTATRPMVGMASSAARRLWAAGELRSALVVTDPDRVRGRRVLAFDDVFTDGSTMREVAGALRRAGAASVSGLALARTPITKGQTPIGRGRTGRLVS